MGVELLKKYVSIAIRSCYIYGSKHPLLVFMFFGLIWMYRSFPLLFSFLVYASPVIASTLLLLGTLLLFGHANAPERNDQGKPHHLDTDNNNNMNINDDHKVGSSVDTTVLRGNSKLKQQVKSELGDQKARFQPSENKKNGLKSRDRSRKNSIDSSCNVLGHRQIDDDNKGWETGSDLVESSSPSASMGDMFPDELRPLLESEVPQMHVSTDAASDHSLESGGMVNETDDYDDDYSDDDQDDVDVKDDDDDEDENVIMWTEDDQKNVMNMGTSELERNQRLENLIARQKALRNMRMMAEKNMVNLSPDLHFNYNSNVNISGFAPSVIIPLRHPFDFPYDPSDIKYNQVGPNFQTNDPFLRRRHESFDVGPSMFGASKLGYNLGPYFVPDGTNYSSMNRTDTESIGSDHTEDNPSREPDLTSVKPDYHTSSLIKVKTRGGDGTGYQEKTKSESSSASFCDVTDDINEDDEEEEFRSIENPTEDSKDLQIVDDNHSQTGNAEKGGLPHRLKSWLTEWKV